MPAEPLANGVHAARIGRAGVEGGPTGRAVVIGAGTIGLLTLQAVVNDGVEWMGALELRGLTVRGSYAYTDR